MAVRMMRTGKRNRFGSVAQRTEYNGVTYDSKAEAEHAALLDREQRALLIRGWWRQVNVPLGSDFKTRVDFLVFTDNGQCHVEEVKGKETDKFKTVRRLWPKYGFCELHVLEKHRNGSWTREVIQGKAGDDH
jgi:hypothetical protein